MTRNIYVLLVGIDKYPNPGDRLNGCVNDIEAVEKFLTNRLKYNSHIEKLIDEQATRQAVINKFENHLCQAGKDDVVLFYFCGHGSQELAAPEFHVLEYDKKPGEKKLETIVCYNSRTVGEDGTEIRDLADKELRYLIAKVAKNEPHILVVYDCCHSSSGTRDTDRKEGVRRLPTDIRPPRAYNEFCFAPDSTIAQNLKQGIFPEGKHVFMSACLYTETAKEINDENGKGRGVFSYFLLKELNSLNAALSYNDLLNEVKGQVHGSRRDQTPQIEPIGMSSQDLNGIAFFGDREVIKPREPYFNLIYRHEMQDRQSAEWIVTGGVSQFLQKDSELAFYPQNSAFDEIKGESGKLGDVKITDVRMEESVVTFISEPEPPKDSFYKAVLTKRSLPTVRFYLEGDAEALAQVEEKLANSLVVGIERERSKPHQYRLYAREQQFEITDASDRLLVVPIKKNGEYDVNKAVKQVEHIARWTKTRLLENPNSSIPKDAIEIEITYNGKVYTNSDLRLEYVGKQAPKIRLKLKNTREQLSQPLYCAILDISDSYAVSILKVFPEGGDGSWIYLNPEQVYQARARSGANFIEEIPFGMPLEVVNQGFTEYQDVLKLIVSTEAFTTLSQFEQNSLLRADQKSREVLTEPPVADWMTKQISLTIVRAKDSVELTPQTEKVLSAGVRVTAPPGLQATASLKSPSSTTRSMSSVALPALLDNTEAFQFSTSRSVGQDASVLELEVNSSTIDAVKPDSPIIISVDGSLQPNERVLAVAHDGQFYFPLGVGQAKNGKIEINIERLCDPQCLNTKEREIRQAIQLCFRKVVLDNLGQKSSYAWLRKATVNGDGTVSYTNKGDMDTVKAAVSKAKNILLYIHGIIGDTESMIPSVRYAKVNVNKQVKSLEELYDLVLAFDYESLNTSIENTARELKQQLAAVGLEPNHGKILHILAHSMGGLVSRSFIEQGNGNKVVSHLIMVGTPNGGSPWATVHDLATTLLSFGLNLSSIPLVPSLLEKLVDAMSVTLGEMHSTKSSFLDELKTFADPQCPYSIIAGSTALMDRSSDVKQLLDALKKKMRRAIALPFGDAENDIAVAISSIIDVPEDRSPAVYTPAPIPCDHLSYFRQPSGLHAIASAIGRAFGYPPEPLPPSSSSSPPGPRPNPSPVSSGNGAQPTGTGSTKTPTEPTHRSSASTGGNSSVLTNIVSQTPASPPPESAQVSPPPNSNHETRTTKWFDTTHVVAIGINNYKKEFAQLESAVNDARTIAGLFDVLASKEKIEKHLLLGEKDKPGATLEKICNRLESLKEEVNDNDRLVFYFAGHGLAIPIRESSKTDSNSQTNKPEGFLIPQDADMENQKTYLSMNELIKRLCEIKKCRQCLIILDCCYAGAVQWSLGITRELLIDKVCPSRLDLYIDSPAWQILVSADETQKANDVLPGQQLKYSQRDLNGQSNSPFVRFLEQALKGEADYHKYSLITTTRLIEYLRDKVENATSEAEKRQTPQLFQLPGKHERGEFVFLLKTFKDVKEHLEKKFPDPKIDDETNPYRGLQSYTDEEKDSKVFFGRERLIEELSEYVQDHLLTVVLGMSGVGKSSLVNAGLIPKLKGTSEKTKLSQPLNSEEKITASPQKWDYAICRPGQFPATALKEALKKLESTKIPDNTKRLLVIDQLEEVETQCRDEEQKKSFWNQLIKELKNNSNKLHLVFTLRSDFESTLRSKFQDAINHESKFTNYWVSGRFIVPAMEREELQDAIEKPTEEMVVYFTSDPKDSDPKKESNRTLVQQLVHEVVGMPGALPLLSLALYTMYRHFAQRYVERLKLGKTTKREITWEDYKSLGDNAVLGSVTRRADEEYNNLEYKLDKVEENGKSLLKVVKDEQGKGIKEEAPITKARQEMLKWLMLRMVTLDDGQRARRRVLTKELKYDGRYDRIKSEQLSLVIQLFDQARLLVQGKVEVEGVESKEKEYVEPAHDALILHWEQLTKWIKEDKENIILRDRILPDINDWKKLKDAEKPSKLPQHVLNNLGNSIDWVVEQLRVKGELKRLNKQENVRQKQSIAASKNGHSSDENTNLSAQETAKTVSEILPSNQAITVEVSSNLPENGYSSENNATVTAQETDPQGHANLTSQEAKGEKASSQTHSENRQHPKSSDRLWDKESRLEVLGQQLGNLRTSKESWLNKTEADFVLQSLIKREKGRALMITFLGAVGLALSLATAWALNEQRNTLIEQIRTSRQSAEANLQANRDLEALTDILRARKTFDNPLISIHIPYTSWQIPIGNSEAERTQVRGTLYKAIYGTKERNRFQLDRAVISGVALHPTKNLLAIAGNQEKTELGEIKDLVFDSKYEKFLTIDKKASGNVKIWETRDAKKGQPVKTQANSVAFSPNNSLFATAGKDGKVKLWKIDKLDKPFLEFDTHQKNIQSIAFNPLNSNSLLTGGEDGTVRLWDISGNKPTPLSVKGDKPVRLALSSDGKRLATHKENQLLMWELDKDRDFKPKDISGTKLAEGQGKYTYISFMPGSSRLVTVDKDSNVKLWDEKGDQSVPLNENETKQQQVKWVTWSKDGKVLATVSNGETIQEKNTKTETETVKLWDFQDGKFQQRTSANKNLDNLQITSIALSFNGEQLATTQFKPRGRIKLWDRDTKTKTVTQTREFQTQQGIINSIAFSPDGKRLVTVGGNSTKKTLRLWDDSGNPLALIQEDKINRARFSPDGRLIAGARESDSQLMVWDVSGDKFNPLYGQKSDQKFGVKAFEFNANGLLATAGQDGKVSLWQIDKGQLLAQACNLVRGYLENNPNVAESDRKLCDDVRPNPVNQHISAGNKILVATLNNPDKQAGVQAFANGDFNTAAKNLETYRISNPNDPEALIYLNNARIGNQLSYTIAVSVPISNNVNGALEILRGVAQAQNTINDSGGINGRKLQVLIADDQNNPELAKQIAEKFSNNSNMLGIIGHYASDTTLAASEIYNKGKLPAISPVSTSVKLSDFNLSNLFGRYTFRTVPSDKQAGKKLVSYMLKQLNKKKAVVFYNSKSEYSKSLMAAFKEAIYLHGKQQGKVVGEIDLSQYNFAKDINQVQQSLEPLPEKPDVIALFPNTEKLDDALAILQANKGQLPVLGGDDLYTKDTLEKGKEDAVGLTLAVPWYWNSANEFSKTSYDFWRARVNWRTAMSYDATKALIAAIKKGKTREGVAEQLRKSKDLSVIGASGEVQFSESGDRNFDQINYPLLTVKKFKGTCPSGTNYDFVSSSHDNQPNCQ